MACELRANIDPLAGQPWRTPLKTSAAHRRANNDGRSEVSIHSAEVGRNRLRQPHGIEELTRPTNGTVVQSRSITPGYPSTKYRPQR